MESEKSASQIVVRSEPKYSPNKGTITGVYFLAALALIISIVAIILIAILLAGQGDLSASINSVAASVDRLTVATQNKPSA